MLWLLLSSFFIWLVAREFYSRVVPARGFERPDPSPISWGYVVTMVGLAVLFGYTPVRYWQFERFLTEKARILSESPKASVHCNTVFDTFFDQNVFAAGHASPETGEIVFQHGWCGHLMTYLNRPAKPTREGIMALHIFTHESMHIRGEYNEAKTECQAIQRNYRAARLLGVPEYFARDAALRYYREDYPRREGIVSPGGTYFSHDCAPGRAWDEKLPDSTWN
jgi:hypothetical protein